MEDKAYKSMHEIDVSGIGTGNWWRLAKQPEILDLIPKATERWKKKLVGIDKPWLCWCVNDKWCIVQQRLVKEVGWTPVVGRDTNIDKPTIVEGSVYLDFNEDFDLPKMFMHFPLEWAYLFVDKLAFWHSDIILSIKDMKYCANIFETLKDGEMAAVKTRPSLLRFWEIPKNRRYFEVVGCTTKGASKSQYDCGCGWWRHIHKHPHYRSEDFRTVPHSEHGVGIRYWKEKYGGKVIPLTISQKGHANANKNRFIKSKEEDLDKAYSLEKIAKMLGVEAFLP